VSGIPVRDNQQTPNTLLLQKRQLAIFWFIADCYSFSGSLTSFSGSIRAVFRQKMTDWTVQSVIVNRSYLGF
jgi:hypothetical protein